jgi:GH25 family lysozyme M1 (1,4-beta-N-acetylmuramidase)
MFFGIFDQIFASGPDVSSVQGGLTLDHWKALEKDNYFAIIKCGNGNDGFDPLYVHNIISARNAGLTVGTYHFVYVLPDAAGHPGRSPEEQADAHWGQENWHDGDMITWADFEWPYPDGGDDWDKWNLPRDGRSDFIADFILRYTSHYSQISGNSIGIYSYPYWIKQAGLASVDRSDEIAALPLWIAGPYVHVPPNSMPDAPSPWTECAVYQWTNSKDGSRVLMPNGAPADWNMCTISKLSSLSVSSTS